MVRKGAARTEWVLSRALCRFNTFDVQGVSRPQRRAALELEVRRWAPFAKPRWYAVGQEGLAQVWVWDGDSVDVSMAAAGVREGRARVLPESVLHPRRDEGVVLVACLDGYEGQAWRAQELVASRWWRDIPREDEWFRFQRDAGVDPGSIRGLPSEAAPVALADRPWAAPWGASLGVAGGTRERWLVAAVAFTLLGSTLWLGSQYVKAAMALSEQRTRLAELERIASPVATARMQALAALDRATALQTELDRFPDQAKLMQSVAALLPKQGVSIREWQYADGTLRLQINAPSAALTSDFVKRFLAAGLFQDVVAQPASASGVLAFSMGVLPLGAPGPANLATSPGAIQ